MKENRTKLMKVFTHLKKLNLQFLKFLCKQQIYNYVDFLVENNDPPSIDDCSYAFNWIGV